MTDDNDAKDPTRASANHGGGRFATLTFEREIRAPASVLWEAWTAPGARAIWASPSPAVDALFDTPAPSKRYRCPQPSRSDHQKASFRSFVT